MDMYGGGEGSSKKDKAAAKRAKKAARKQQQREASTILFEPKPGAAAGNAWAAGAAPVGAVAGAPPAAMAPGGALARTKSQEQREGVIALARTKSQEQREGAATHLPRHTFGTLTSHRLPRLRTAAVSCWLTSLSRPPPCW
jgi:hypothetical protein